jgi:hypothetical protein
MTDKQKQEALKAFYKWCEDTKITLNGIKEIRISQDAWLGCWELLKGEK